MDERTYGVWHTFVPDVGPGQVYGYRVPARDPAKLLLDPYARQVTGTDYDLVAAASYGVADGGLGAGRGRGGQHRHRAAFHVGAAVGALGADRASTRPTSRA